MKTPLSSSNTTADIHLGHHSDGSPSVLNLTNNAPLFITHPDKRMWRALIADAGAALRDRTDIHWLLCLDQNSLAAWRGNAPTLPSLDSFITDDPGSGTLTSRKDFVKAMRKVFKHRAETSKKKSPVLHICIIDDVWELIQKTEPAYRHQIARILQHHNPSSLLILAGSSAGNRTLFPQLLIKRPGKTSPHTQQPLPQTSPGSCPGTELILGTEGLIFRSNPGGQIWDKWYAPVHWIASPDPSLTFPQTGELPSPDAPNSAAVPAVSLPENAELFMLDA